MSYAVDKRYDVYLETLRCAAKNHACDACSEAIEKGHRYYSVSWVFDGSASSVKRCLKCQAIHVHLRGLDPGEMWPDEELNCGQDYLDEWGCDPPDEVAKLAFMSQAEAQKELAP